MKYLRVLWPALVAVPVLVMVLAADAQEAAPVPVGRDLAANCFQCHGTNGRAVKGMPSIAGEDAASTYGSMLEYKERSGVKDIMVPIAHAYSDQQLWELSLYLASLPEHPEEPEEDGQRVPDDEPLETVEPGGDR